MKSSTEIVIEKLEELLDELRKLNAQSKDKPQTTEYVTRAVQAPSAPKRRIRLNEQVGPEVSSWGAGGCSEGHC